MPLVFNQPEVVTLAAAKITSLKIQLEPLAIVISYNLGPVSGVEVVEVKEGSQAFDQSEYAQLDPAGATYDAVKALAYQLLETKLGAGSVT